MKRWRQGILSLAGNIRLPADRASTVGLVLLVLVLFVVPIPAFLLDLLIVLNVTLGVVVLLRGLLLRGGERMASFPSLLLLLTLFRLALNVSSTRMILLYGDRGTDVAGSVIQSFGSFVVQGDFIVGALLFVVITVVNLLVVAKGSARVAEVAARFSLDSLPGKQLAIDAEARNGGLSLTEARALRAELAQESQFFGAMDGAMKFVQGDALAGLIITGLNAVAGIALGVSRGLDLSTAVSNFGILTIGDGLVHIIPAILVSVCAGMVVTRVESVSDSGSGNFGLGGMFSDPRVLLVSAFVLVALAVVPGLPFVPFITVSIGLFVLSIYRGRVSQTAMEISSASGSSSYVIWGTASQGAVQPLILELGSLLVPVGKEFVEFSEWATRTVEDIELRTGVDLPAIVLRVSPNWQDSQYRALVRERVIRSGTAPSALVFVPGDTVDPVPAPVGGKIGSWRKPDQVATTNQELLRPNQFAFLELIGGAIEEVDQLLGIEEVRGDLSSLREHHPGLIAEILDSGKLSVGEYTELLRRLVREGVSIRDRKLVLEGIAEFISLRSSNEDRTELLDELHSYVRRVLARGIVADSLSDKGSLCSVTLSMSVEEEFRSAAVQWEGARASLPLEPDRAEKIYNSLSQTFEPIWREGANSLTVICSRDIRPAVEGYLRTRFHRRGWLRTLAYEELCGEYQSDSRGVVDL